MRQHLSTLLAVFGLGVLGSASVLSDQPRKPEYPSIHSDDPKEKEKRSAYWTAYETYQLKAKAWVLAILKDAQTTGVIELISVSPKVLTEPVDGGLSRVLDVTDQQNIAGYPIISKSVVKLPHEKQLIISELNRAITQGPEEMADCFAPRHALRINLEGNDYYVLICFECSTARIFQSTTGAKHAIESPIGKAPETLFNQLMISHSMEKAP
jgi:hypothetical protein